MIYSLGILHLMLQNLQANIRQGRNCPTTTNALAYDTVIYHCKKFYSFRRGIFSSFERRHDIQHNDTQHNYTKHNETQHNGTLHNFLFATLSIDYTQHYDIQHNVTHYWVSIWLVSLHWVLRLLKCYTECRYVERR
jgi:hypothetical protein